MANGSVHDQPAVHDELVPGDVAGGIRGEEEGVGDLLRASDAPERDALPVRTPHLGRVRLGVERRVDRSRGERIHGDPRRAELDGECLRQRHHRALGGGVRTDSSDSDDSRDRGQLRMRPPLPLSTMWREALRQP